MAWTGHFNGSTSQGYEIEPEAFMNNFGEDTHPRETDLLYEIHWGRSPRTWKNSCTNDPPLHAEINFLENKWMEHPRRRNTPCYITWFLSWSPCGACSYDIIEFLDEHPNVTLDIRTARLYRYHDERNREGLRNLDESGAKITIMHCDDFIYCWKTFVDQQSGVNYSLRRVLEHVYSEKVYWNYSKELEQILNNLLPKHQIFNIHIRKDYAQEFDTFLKIR